MVFLAAVVVPVARRKEIQGVKGKLIQWTGERFRFIGWVCLIFLVITGFFNLFYHGIGFTELLSEAFWSGYFGRVLAHKLVLVGIIFILSFFHDFVIGPKAAALMGIGDTYSAAEKLRKRSSWIGRINLLLGLVVVFLGIMLVRGLP